MKLVLKAILSSYSFFVNIKKLLRLKTLKLRGVKIGKGTYLSPKAYIDVRPPGKIMIGKNCNIARNAIILCHSGETKGGPQEIWAIYGGKRIYKDVIIGNNVFIGANAVVYPGVIIGNNSIIAANSVVNMDVPQGTVVGGVPIKIIMKTKDLLKSKCLDFDEEHWNKIFE